MVDESSAPAPSLIGRVIESEAQGGVRYLLEELVGTGGMGMAFLARRDGPHGSSPVVVKVVNASIGGGEVAPELLALKEAVALGRLNESLAPTPFVVRFIDAGNAPLFGPTATPWTAIEYVHGGIEGTTLEDRVTYSVHKTGYGFDPRRAMHAVRCLSGGLTAIHEVGVLHRDLTPGNVLCCGFGEAEIFKISDFGIARASGLSHTFVGLVLGTLGYSAPESQHPLAGPASDVFSFATVVYYLLTGQHYFDPHNPNEAMRLYLADARPSITDHATLTPELLAQPLACRSLDSALARATSASAEQRPQTAAQFAASLLPWLGDAHAGPRSSHRLLSAVLSTRDGAPALEDGWTVRSRPSDDKLITSVAWETDGHALVLSVGGAYFWNGSDFVDARRLFEKLPAVPTFVQRYDAGGWLVGGNGPVLSVLDAHGVRDRMEARQADTRFTLACGRFDDLLAAVGTRPGEPPTLFAVSGKRWVRPLPLPGVANVTTLQRLDEDRWLVGGRLHDAGGFAAVYTPLELELRMLALPPLRAIIGGASASERGVALLVGSQGATLRFELETRQVSSVPGEPDLSVAALDILDREWVASPGALWSRDARNAEPWRAMWRDPTWHAPFVSLMADAGIVMAMTADAAVLEGRSAGPATRRGGHS